MKKKKLKLNPIPGGINTFKDYSIKYSSVRKKYDVLFFIDSRGISLDEMGRSWSNNLYKYLIKKGYHCLLTNRMKAITIFLTLKNFVEANNLKFDYLITNVGFVDFTPKKMSIIENIIEQKNVFSKKKLPINKFGKYKLLDGSTEQLYSCDMDILKKDFVDFLNKNFKYSLLLGSFESNPNVKVKRKRPKEFFSQIKKANNFLYSLSDASDKIHYVQPLKYQYDFVQNISYDNCHFTKFGHKKMYSIVKSIFMSQICD